MKGYVIKNKEGKYLSKYNKYDYSIPEYYKQDCWTNNLLNAKIFNQEPILKNESDCTVAEITITEGNLESNQNQKAIGCLKELKEKLKMYCDYYFTVDDADGWYLPETNIDLLIDNKIKELEGNND